MFTILCLFISDFTQNCCKDVLVYVAENIGENWSHLLALLKKRHSLNDERALIDETASEAIKVGVAKPGDLMVIVSGMLYGQTSNNQVRVESIPAATEGSSSGGLKRLVSFVHQSQAE